jgi:hypothetical protein
MIHVLNLLYCHTAVLEIPDSFLLLQRKFPQLADGFNVSYRSDPDRAGGGLVAEGERLRMIEKYSYLEHLLYEAVVRKVEGRVRELHNTNKKKE